MGVTMNNPFRVQTYPDEFVRTEESLVRLQDQENSNLLAQIRKTEKPSQPSNLEKMQTAMH